MAVTPIVSNLVGLTELDAHMREIGHCLETKEAGTNVLAKCIIHFN